MDIDLFVVYNAHDIKFNGGACAVCPSPGQSDGGTGNVTSCHVPAGPPAHGNMRMIAILNHNATDKKTGPMPR